MCRYSSHVWFLQVLQVLQVLGAVFLPRSKRNEAMCEEACWTITRAYVPQECKRTQWYKRTQENTTISENARHSTKSCNPRQENTRVLWRIRMQARDPRQSTNARERKRTQENPWECNIIHGSDRERQGTLEHNSTEENLRQSTRMQDSEFKTRNSREGKEAQHEIVQSTTMTENARECKNAVH